MEIDQTTRVLLRQGRSESVCKLLDTNLKGQAEIHGVSSQEYIEQTIEYIETLIEGSIDYLDAFKPDQAIPLLNKVLQWTSENDTYSIPQPHKSKYRATSSFLSGCAEKMKKNYETSANFYMGAATYFESVQMVSEVVVSSVGAAHTLIELDRMDEALSYIENAADLLSSPECSKSVANPVYEAQAFVYMKLGRMDEATKALSNAIHYRNLTSFLPRSEKKTESSQSSRSSSTRSNDRSSISPPSESTRGGNIRLRMMRNRKEQNPAFPYKELGMLQLSVSKLVSYC